MTTYSATLNALIWIKISAVCEIAKRQNDGADSDHTIYLPYFFGYKTEISFLPKNPKNLDPSYQTDLDLWDCLGRVKTRIIAIIAKFHRTGLVICSHYREVKNPFL